MKDDEPRNDEKNEVLSAEEALRLFRKLTDGQKMEVILALRKIESSE